MMKHCFFCVFAFLFVFSFANHVSAELRKPRSVAVDDKHVYVLDGENRTWMFSLKKYKNSGEFLSVLNKRALSINWEKKKNKNQELSAVLEKVFFPDFINMGFDGFIYGVGVGAKFKERCRVGAISAVDGSTVMSFGEFSREEGSYGLWNPMGIALDSNSNIYIADQGHKNIKKYDRSGNLLKSWGERGGGRGQFENPIAIAVDKRDDSVYVVDSYSTFNRPSQARVQKFTKDGKFLLKWGEHFGIKWWSVGIEGINYPILTNIPDLDTPAGIAVDSRGFVYVVERGKNRINKYDDQGRFILSFGGTFGSGPGEFKLLGKTNIPVGIAVDPADNIYVCDEENNRVQKFDQNGKFLLEIK